MYSMRSVLTVLAISAIAVAAFALQILSIPGTLMAGVGCALVGLWTIVTSNPVWSYLTSAGRTQRLNREYWRSVRGPVDQIRKLKTDIESSRTQIAQEEATSRHLERRVRDLRQALIDADASQANNASAIKQKIEDDLRRTVVQADQLDSSRENLASLVVELERRIAEQERLITVATRLLGDRFAESYRLLKLRREPTPPPAREAGGKQADRGANDADDGTKRGAARDDVIRRKAQQILVLVLVLTALEVGITISAADSLPIVLPGIPAIPLPASVIIGIGIASIIVICTHVGVDQTSRFLRMRGVGQGLRRVLREIDGLPSTGQPSSTSPQGTGAESLGEKKERIQSELASSALDSLGAQGRLTVSNVSEESYVDEGHAESGSLSLGVGMLALGLVLSVFLGLLRAMAVSADRSLDDQLFSGSGSGAANAQGPLAGVGFLTIGLGLLVFVLGVASASVDAQIPEEWRLQEREKQNRRVTRAKAVLRAKATDVLRPWEAIPQAGQRGKSRAVEKYASVLHDRFNALKIRVCREILTSSQDASLVEQVEGTLDEIEEGLRAEMPPVAEHGKAE